MAKNAILYVDLLGVQKMWELSGPSAVKDRIDSFHKFIQKKVTELPDILFREGECTFFLIGDSVSVLCQDIDQAVGIGIFIFVQTFFEKQERPFWLRGAISHWHNQNQLINTQPFNIRRKAKNICLGTSYLLEDDFLLALGLEKSGFKGMRLLIDQKLMPDFGRKYQRHWVGFKRDLGYVRRIEGEELYPKNSSYADVLWMTENEEQFEKLNAILEQRFRHSITDPDEFTQTSWTRVIFDQVNSLIWRCKQ